MRVSPEGSRQGFVSLPRGGAPRARSPAPGAIAALAAFASVQAPFAPRAEAQGGPVSFYALRNAGTARSVGLSGATVALPGDDQLAMGNPASPVFLPGLLALHYFGLDQSKADPRFAGSEPGAERGFDASLAVRPVEAFAASVGYAKLATEHTREINERSFLSAGTEGGDLPVVASARIHERVGIGGGVVFSNREYWREAGETKDSASRTARQSFSGRAWKAGAIGAVSETLSVGLSYESARDLERGDVEGDTLAAATRYVEPWVAKAGICYLLVPDEGSLLPVENFFLLGVDLLGWEDHGEGVPRHAAATLGETENTRLPYPAPERLAASGATYDTGQKLVPRLGIETRWFRSSNAQLSTFVGSWYEPRYVDGNTGAFHTTVGAEFSLWRISVQAAADIARRDVRTVWSLGATWR